MDRISYYSFMISSLSKYLSPIVAISLGLLALLVPLLRDFHLESALAAALVGCFWAGWKAAGKSNKGPRDLADISRISAHLFLFGLPLLVYTIATGCFSIHGLGFWLLYPVPSVFFGYAVGRVIRFYKIAFARWMTAVILLAIGVGGLLIEFYTLPQVYFFNHVWGGWPGPIYDETVQITGSLLYFRAITLFWILLLWSIPAFQDNKEARWIVWLSGAALMFSYFHLAEAGIISPRSYLQNELGAQKETPHFNIYYDSTYYSGDDIQRIALEHEFYLDEIAAKLQLSKPASPQKIESYLYGHPWQKKKLVGAKFTSYVPVWLRQDQLHIARQQLAGSLEHELVHVLAKKFGNRLLNASWSIGLIEGLAVALSPDASPTSTINQIVVSEKPYPTADEMEHALSLLGFYGGRSTVNYTTAGSFVAFLLENYPVQKFKAAYRTGDVAGAFETPLDKLVENWHRHLDTVTADSLDEETARRLFSLPSLFEKQCPHVLSELAFNLDRYLFHRAEKDTSRYLEYLDQASGLRPQNLGLKAEWSFRNLEAGFAEKVVQQASQQDSSAELQMLYADAQTLTGNREVADLHLQQASGLLDADADTLLHIALQTRQDSLQWHSYLGLRYSKNNAGLDFENLFYRTKIRALQQAMEEQQWIAFREYSKRLAEDPSDDLYFDTYSSMIHMLAYLGERDLAYLWIKKLNVMELRQRYRERLNQQVRWINFLDGYEVKN